MVSLINKQLLLTAYAYLFIMEQQKAQQGGEALQLQVESTQGDFEEVWEQCRSDRAFGGKVVAILSTEMGLKMITPQTLEKSKLEKAMKTSEMIKTALMKLLAERKKVIAEVQDIFKKHAPGTFAANNDIELLKKTKNQYDVELIEDWKAYMASLPTTVVVSVMEYHFGTSFGAQFLDIKTTVSDIEYHVRTKLFADPASEGTRIVTWRTSASTSHGAQTDAHGAQIWEFATESLTPSGILDGPAKNWGVYAPSSTDDHHDKSSDLLKNTIRTWGANDKYDMEKFKTKLDELADDPCLEELNKCGLTTHVLRNWPKDPNQGHWQDYEQDGYSFQPPAQMKDGKESTVTETRVALGALPKGETAFKFLEKFLPKPPDIGVDSNSTYWLLGTDGLDLFVPRATPRMKELAVRAPKLNCRDYAYRAYASVENKLRTAPPDFQGFQKMRREQEKREKQGKI